jgi:hypothetical protein
MDFKRRFAIAALLFSATAALAQDAAPAYAPDGKLLFPTNYREWIYLSSDFDLSYSSSVPPNTHVFGNVFVNRAAYEAFRKTKAWPNGTMLVLELRGAGADNPLNKRGQYQAGIAGVELHVKDAAKGGWGFYEFNPAHVPAQALPKTAACFACHEKNGVSDTTFTQFYPTLSE